MPCNRIHGHTSGFSSDAIDESATYVSGPIIRALVQMFDFASVVSRWTTSPIANVFIAYSVGSHTDLHYS